MTASKLHGALWNPLVWLFFSYSSAAIQPHTPHGKIHIHECMTAKPKLHKITSIENVFVSLWFVCSLFAYDRNYDCHIWCRVRAFFLFRVHYGSGGDKHTYQYNGSASTTANQTQLIKVSTAFYDEPSNFPPSLCVCECAWLVSLFYFGQA